MEIMLTQFSVNQMGRLAFQNATFSVVRRFHQGIGFFEATLNCRSLKAVLSLSASLMSSLFSVFLSLVLASSFYCCGCESQKELLYKDIKEESYKQLSPSFRSNSVNPRRVLQLSWRPRVFFYRGFLSEEECDHLIALGKESLGVEGFSGNAHIKRQLQSTESRLNIPDYIVARIEERISAWTFLPRENSEPMQVTLYGFEKSEQKLDYFSSKSGSESSELLMAVIILYLSNVTRGGEILFPYSEVKTKIWSDCTKTGSILRPAKGNAVLFFTRNLNASLDPTSSHARCPLVEGEMWCATKFFYAKPANRDSELVEQDDSKCEDEDDHCPRWAALGECQKNPVYMIGSPDYFGTCRKSCNAC